jgi:putative membrane protein
MILYNLPTLNAALNSLSAIFLVLGYIKIKNSDQETHKKFMIAALISSALFLTCYLIYHYNVGSVLYPYHDWTRVLYYLILIPHIILATVMTPFILIAVWFALSKRYEKHKRIVRWVWPVWMFVSLSGVTIYVMLYLL